MVKVVDVFGFGQPKRVVDAVRLHLAGSPLFNLLVGIPFISPLYQRLIFVRVRKRARICVNMKR